MSFIPPRESDPIAPACRLLEKIQDRIMDAQAVLMDGARAYQRAIVELRNLQLMLSCQNQEVLA